MIEITRLTKRFGVKTVLDDVSLLVEPGSVYGLIGRNGAGKSTLLHCLMNICRPTSGRVRVDGIIDSVDIRRRVAWVPQRRVPYAGYSVESFCAFAASFYDDADVSDVLTVATDFGLTPDERADAQSPGDITKVFLAIALGRSVPWLVLDEPFDGLDRQSQTLLLTRLAKATGPNGSGAILSTHRLETVQQICDTIGILADGRLLYSGPIDDLLERWRVFTIWNGTIEGDWLSHPSVEAVNRTDVSVQVTTSNWAALQAALGSTEVDHRPMSLSEIYLALTGDEVAA